MLAQIRAAGLVRLVAIDQFTDIYGGAVSAVSVPVFSGDGAMVLSIGAIGAAEEMDTREAGQVVTRLRDVRRPTPFGLSLSKPCAMKTPQAQEAVPVN